MSYISSVFFIKYFLKSGFNHLFFINILAIFSIVGGRLGFLFFYNFQTISENFKNILNLWNGGLSSHGSLLGIIVLSILGSKIYGHNKLKILDISLVLSLLAGFFIRLGNYFNSEKIGLPTNGSWGVIFLNNSNHSFEPRHPSQLYESLFCFQIKKKRNQGFVSSKILFFLFGFRLLNTCFFVESLPFVEIILNFISVFLGAVLYVCLMNNNELGKYKIKS
jgi:phosphatidylglycerol:prolipoprotein diacylglycerol transferase